jgi:hypothetical protein
MLVPAVVEFWETVASVLIPVGTGATSHSGKVAELDPSDAITCAVVSDVTTEVATGKLALVAPAGTNSDDWMIAWDVSSLSATVVPPDGAAELIVTRHVDGAGGMTESGVQEIAVTLWPLCWIVTVLPVVEVGIAKPGNDADTPLETWIAEDVSVVEPEIVKASVATTPFAMALELIPETTHLETPDVLLQLIDFPAAVAAAPAVTTSALKSWGK